MYSGKAPGDPPTFRKFARVTLAVQFHCYKVKFNNFLVFLSHPAYAQKGES